MKALTTKTNYSLTHCLRLQLTSLLGALPFFARCSWVGNDPGVMELFGLGAVKLLQVSLTVQSAHSFNSCSGS